MISPGTPPVRTSSRKQTSDTPTGIISGTEIILPKLGIFSFAPEKRSFQPEKKARITRARTSAAQGSLGGSSDKFALIPQNPSAEAGLCDWLVLFLPVES